MKVRLTPDTSPISSFRYLSLKRWELGTDSPQASRMINYVYPFSSIEKVSHVSSLTLKSLGRSMLLLPPRFEGLIHLAIDHNFLEQSIHKPRDVKKAVKGGRRRFLASPIWFIHNKID